MKAPGPTSIEFLKGIHHTTPEFFDKLRDKYGGIVRCKPPLCAPIYLISEPEAAKYILSHNASNYVRNDFVSRRFRALFGNGSVVAEQDLWAQQRKILNPLFQHKNLLTAFTIITTETNKLLNSWSILAKQNKQVGVLKQMQNLLLDLLWRILLTHPTDGIRQSILYPVDLGVNYVGSLLPFYYPKWFPTYSNFSFYVSNKKLEKIIYAIIQNRVINDKNRTSNPDMLDRLLQYKDPTTKKCLSNHLIMEEIKTMTPAGFLTTSSAITWFFYELGNNPQYMDTISEECTELLKTGPMDYNKMTKLNMTTQFLYETLRLHPTGWTLWRSAKNEDIINDYKIEAGASMVVSPYTTHRNPKYWPNPNKFNPHRNFHETVDYSYFPFGLGPRKCLGENLAMVEMLVIIPMILSKFKFRLVKNQNIKIDHRVILTPKPEVNIHLQPI